MIKRGAITRLHLFFALMHNKTTSFPLYQRKSIHKDMATITLEYDGRNSAIKQLIQVLFTLGAKEAEPDTKEAQTKMVKDSLTTAFDELYAGKARKNARNLFA